MKKIVIITIFVLLFLPIVNNRAGLPVVAVAKAGILDRLPIPEIMPDTPLYILKLWYEKAIIFLSFGDIKKAERYSKLAAERLKEAEQMVKVGKEELAKKALAEYEVYLNKALGKADELKQQAAESVKQKARENINQTLEKVSESTLKNQEVLLRVYELVPDQAKEAIERVIELTKTGYEHAVEAISGIKKEELQQKAEDIKARAQELIKNWRDIFGD